MAIKIPIVTVFDNKGLKQAQGALGKVGSVLGGLGKGIGVAAAATAAVAGLGVKFAKAAEEAAKVDAKLANVTNSMGLFGSQTGQVVSRLQGVSEELMKSTGIDDEKIKSTQALLMTFKNLAGTAGETGGSFDRATKAALDLEAVGFGGAEGAAKQLGKALENPIKGITALTRSGVTFTDAEKEKITALTESGRILEAQNMILSAVETQVGGTAEATKTASMVMSTAFGEFQEQVGSAILPLFEQLATIVTDTLGPLAEQLAPIFQSVFEAIVPVIEKLAPILVTVLEKLSPIFDTLMAAVGPLVDALMPIVNAVLMIVDALAPLIEMFMPVFTQLIGIAAEVLGSLAVALMPIIEALLPPFLKLVEALLPFIQMFADILTRYVLPILLKLVESTVLPALVFLIETLTNGFKWLNEVLGPVYEAIKPVLDALLAIAGIKAGELTKTITVNTKVVNDPKLEAATRNTALDNYLGFLGGRAKEAGTKVDNSLAGTLTGTTGNGSKTKKAAKKSGKETGKAWLNSWQAKIDKDKGFAASAARAAKLLEDAFKIDTTELETYGSNAATKFLKGFNSVIKGMGAATENQAEALIRWATPFFEKMQGLADAIFKRETWKKEFQQDLMGVFTFESAKKGLKSLMDDMRKSVQQLKTFRDNIAKLVELGLDPELLRKITDAKDFAAAAELVKGGAGSVNELNALYGELATFSAQTAQSVGDQFFNLGRNFDGTIRTLEQGVSLVETQFELSKKLRKMNSDIFSARMDLKQEALYGISKADRKARQAEIDAMVAERDKFKNATLEIRKALGIATNLDRAFLETGRVDPELWQQFTGLQNFGKGAQQADMRSQASYIINVNGGIGTSAEIGKLVVQAIRAYEKANGLVTR